MTGTDQSSFFGGFFGREKGFGAHEFADVLAPDYLQNSNFNALPELYTTGFNAEVMESPQSDKLSEALSSPRIQPATHSFMQQQTMPTRIYPITTGPLAEDSSTLDDVQSEGQPKINPV